MNFNTCGCCEPAAQPTPFTVENRPGLSAIAYRIGTYSAFRQAMLQAIAGTPELAALSSRLSDDYAITILELWAVVADVLTFYQERIANEAFLRTARLRDSVLRMARLIDYQLGPGAAATALLAFTLEKNAGLKIPVGLRVQSVPGQDEKPQKFETIEAISADARWNLLRVVPAPIGVNPLGKGNSNSYLAPGSDSLVTAAALAPRDRVVVFRSGSSFPVEELEIREIRVDHDQALLVWSPSIQGSHWDAASDVFQFKRVFRMFGFNAPETYMQAVADQSVAGGIRWSLLQAGYIYAGGTTLDLDAHYGDIAVGAQLLVLLGVMKPRFVTVTAVGQTNTTVGPMSDTVTQLTITPALPSGPLSNVRIYELTGLPIRFWGYTYLDSMPSSAVYLPGSKVDAQTIEVGRTIAKDRYQAGVVINLKDVEPGRRVLLQDARERPVAATIVSASLHGSDMTFSPTPGDLTTAAELGLTLDKAQTITGIASARFLKWPGFAQPQPHLAVTIGKVGPRIVGLSLPIDEFNISQKLQTGINAAGPEPEFAQARVAAVDNRLLILPGVAGTAITITATDADPVTAVELGLDSGSAAAVTGLASAPLNPFPLMTEIAPELSISIGVNGSRKLELGIAPASLISAANQLEAALHAADVAPAFSQARVLAIGNQLIVLTGIVGADVQAYLKIDIEPEEAADLDARSAVLMGNVARASHGESVKEEILGDGDASAKFQHFFLKKKPLTFIPSAVQGGLQSSLKVLVNRTLWNPVADLYGQASNAPVYVTRLADDGTVNVRFGDNRTGAAPFSGRGNIMAFYRYGLGLAGRVRAKTLNTLLDRPVGLKSVTNPLPADGGADPERLDEARERAPATVRTFGRAVSLRDFEDLVTEWGEVAKARAIWLWNGLERVVHLTIAGQDAGTFSSDALTRIQASLTAARDPNYTLLLDNFVRVPMVVGATLHISDTHVAGDVEAAARTTLLAALSFESLHFGQAIHLSDVYHVLQEVPGVDWLKIDLLQFKDQSPAYLDSRGADDQPVQEHLRIYPARITQGVPAAVLPSEQAWIEEPAKDIILLTSGGLPH